jgi:hypothetical protein
MRVNRSIPSDLEEDSKHLKKGQSAFWRKGDVMVQVRKDKRLVRMMSTIHDATVLSKGQKHKKTNTEIKKHMNKMYQVIRLHYQWPSMRKDVEEYMKKCAKCQMNKTLKPRKSSDGNYYHSQAPL